jgi:hypothetical protein
MTRHFQLVGALGWFWKTRSYFAEGLEQLTTALEGRRQEPTAFVARALAAEEAIRGSQGDDSGLATPGESIGPARAALGQEADAVYQKGRALALEEAVAEALGQL